MTHARAARTAALRTIVACVAAMSCTKIPEGDRTLDAKELPAVVRLRGEGGFCSGSLVAPRVVLTARHCLRPGADPSDVIIRDGTIIKTSHARVWPAADLALLLLERAAPPDVKPLQLPSANDTTSLNGREGRLVGFGFARFRPAAQSARPIGTNRSDRPLYVPDTDDDVGKHLAMARVVGDTDGALLLRVQPERACHGDSGGPILVGEGDTAFVAAVTSIKMDIEDGKRCSGVASGARVVDHLPFIRSFIDGTRDRAAELGDACYFETHCKAGLACEPLAERVAARVCVGPCGEKGTCGVGLDCVAAKCRPSASPAGGGVERVCSQDTDCAGGGLCTREPGTAEKRCRARCWLGGPNQCATGTACLADLERPTRHVCASGVAWVNTPEGRGGTGAWVYALGMIGFIVVMSIAARRGRGRGPRLRG